MKQRFDFVSNSSSSSFIVDINNDKDKFINLIRIFKDATSIKIRAKNTFSPDLMSDIRKHKYSSKYSNNEVIYLNMKQYMKEPNNDILTQLINESDCNIEVENGNDFDDMSSFYLFGAWLESKGFKVVNNEDSSLSYDGIKQFDELLEESK